MSYYVIGGDGKRYGPEGVEVLQQWAREGRLVATTQLVELETGRQLYASQLPDLAGLIQPPPAPPRPAMTVPPVPPARAMPQANMFPPAPQPMQPPWALNAPSSKSKVTAGILGILLGWLGLHRFYLGHVGIGIIQLLLSVATCMHGAPIAFVWGFVEGILCLTGNIRDAEGRPLRD